MRCGEDSIFWYLKMQTYKLNTGMGKVPSMMEF